MSYSQSWLEDPSSVKMVLVVATAYNVLNSTETSFYFSNTGYVTLDGIQFDPVISNEITLTESISQDGGTSMTFGDIELYNLNGEYDDLLDTSKYLWNNRTIKIYYGDPGWRYNFNTLSTNFLTIFDGLIDDIDSRVNRTINFKLRDKLEKLNGPITENKVGTYGVWPGGQQNQDQIRPVVFGECFNVSPLLINPATLEYCFSTSTPDQISGFGGNGTSERLLEIRDNGVPIYIDGNNSYQGAVVDLTTSTFTLNSTPSGAITCTVQGVKKTMNTVTGAITNTYTNTIPSIIGVIVQTFGKSGGRLSVSELDLPTFNSFNQTAEVGLLVSDRENILTVCRNLASSVGGQVVVGRTGKLRLLQYGVPLSTSIVSNVDITQDDVVYDSLNIVSRLALVGAIKIAYAKNYTVQQNLFTSIPDSHKKSYETEWYTVTSKNSTVITLNKFDSDPPQKDTYLISTLDATTEADRLLNYYDEQRMIYRFTGTPRLLNLVLGQQVTLYYPRFGLSGGKTGQVVSISPNWSRDRTEVEVLV